MARGLGIRGVDAQHLLASTTICALLSFDRHYNHYDLIRNDRSITTALLPFHRSTRLGPSMQVTEPSRSGLTAPSTPGTYYYGACVDSVIRGVRHYQQLLSTVLEVVVPGRPWSPTTPVRRRVVHRAARALHRRHRRQEPASRLSAETSLMPAQPTTTGRVAGQMSSTTAQLR